MQKFPTQQPTSWHPQEIFLALPLTMNFHDGMFASCASEIDVKIVIMQQKVLWKAVYRLPCV